MWQQYYGIILNAYVKINFGLYHNKLIFPFKKHVHVLNLTVEIFCFHPIDPKNLITCCSSTLYKPFRKVFLYTLQTLQENIIHIWHTIWENLPHFTHHSGKCLPILYTLVMQENIFHTLHIIQEIVFSHFTHYSGKSEYQSSAGDYTSICL